MAPTDYSKGQIYTLRSKSRPDLVYVGSTCNPLRKRLYQHRSNFKAWQEGRFAYLTSFEIFKIGDAYIEWLEDFPTDSKKKLNRREGEIIRNMECVNQCIAGRTKKEWTAENKEHVKELYRNYYEANKEKVQKVNKVWAEHNKQKVQQYHKQYRQDNKEALKAKKEQKVTCECGAMISHANILRHYQTPKHIEWFIWH